MEITISSSILLAILFLAGIAGFEERWIENPSLSPVKISCLNSLNLDGIFFEVFSQTLIWKLGLGLTFLLNSMISYMIVDN